MINGIYKSEEDEEEGKYESQEVELSYEIVVENITIDFSADECSVKIFLKTLKNRYVEVIEHIHVFIEEKAFPPKVHNLYSFFKDQVEKFLIERKTSMHSLISYLGHKYS